MPNKIKQVKPGLTPAESARPMDDEGYPYKLPQVDDTSQRVTPVDGGKKENVKKPTYTPNVVHGEGSHKRSAWVLEACEVDKDRRNFPGVVIHEPDVELLDIVSNEGATETKGGRGINKSHTNAAGQLQRRFE